MKKHLLPQGKYYKANLHMHSTVSDGKLSPEEIKRAFMEKGYSIVAYTDHEILVPHNELSDENFLAITATELAFNLYPMDGGYPYIKTYHLNFLSKNPNKSVISIWDKHYVFDSVLPKISKEQWAVQYKRDYGVEEVNKAIALAKAEGFLVSYNHPTWSLQDYGDYGELEGLWGVECYNNLSERVGLSDTDRPFNDLLVQGKTVFPLATDDAHALEDCFGGWVMVSAEKLEYGTVMNALEKGEFYASAGPEIYELSINDGIVHIECSPVREIHFNTECRFASNTCMHKEPLTSVDIDIRPYLEHKKTASTWRKPFIRFRLIDERGKMAYTRAYSLEELR
ncbi:MAG: hypothetical protein E7368_04330 [Clostridiales bacterium]|nr:hypothetical protein [Clostridiales bacterium]